MAAAGVVSRARRMVRGNAPIWAAALPPLVFAAATLQLALAGVDPDYWWHITTGRWMLDHGRIPTTDPFSVSHLGQNWYAHEWLAELCFGVLDRIAGYAGEILVTAAIVAAGGWLLGRAARYYGVGAREALLLVAGSGFFVLGNLAVRPQVWGWALFALLLHELAAHDNGRRRTLWHLPLLFALWINVHLSVLMGGGAYALYTGHRLLLWCFGRCDRPAGKNTALHCLAVGAVSALALCLNPRGPALLWFTRVYLDQHAERLRYISEWQRPQFAGDNRWLMIGGVALVMLTVAAMVSRRRLWPGVLVPLFGLAALRAIRYVPLFGIVTPPALGWVAGRFRGRSVSLTPITVPPALAIGCVAVAVAWIGVGSAGSSQLRRTPNAHEGGYPVAAADWVRANVPKGTVCGEYGWGGYLIYRFYPTPRVYMDGREEMYGERFFTRYVSTINAEEGWQERLSEAGIRAVIVNPQGPLATAMSGDPGWSRPFADNVAAVYVPASADLAP